MEKWREWPGECPLYHPIRELPAPKIPRVDDRRQESLGNEAIGSDNNQVSSSFPWRSDRRKPTLEGGAGDDELWGDTKNVHGNTHIKGEDHFVFVKGEGGTDTIFDFDFDFGMDSSWQPLPGSALIFTATVEQPQFPELPYTSAPTST